MYQLQEMNYQSIQLLLLDVAAKSVSADHAVCPFFCALYLVAAKHGTGVDLLIIHYHTWNKSTKHAFLNLHVNPLTVLAFFCRDDSFRNYHDKKH